MEYLNSIFTMVTDRTETEVIKILDHMPDIAIVELMPTLKLILLLIVVTLAFGILFRLLFGIRSNMNRAMSAALGILCIYAVTIVIYTLDPWKLTKLLSPLPFAVFKGDLLFLIPFRNTDFTTICSHVLSLVILAFLVNLADAIMPDGRNPIVWYILRFFTVVFAMILNLVCGWALNRYLPGFLVQYAPALLLILLVCFLLLGISKVILGIVLTAVNPWIGGLYTFFFSNFIGRQLTKAVLSAFLLCLLFFFLEYFGYSVIAINNSALLSYIPLAGSLLVLWYLLGHEL